MVDAEWMNSGRCRGRVRVRSEVTRLSLLGEEARSISRVISSVISHSSQKERKAAWFHMAVCPSPSPLPVPLLGPMA